MIFSIVLHVAKLFQGKILIEDKPWFFDMIPNNLFSYDGGAQRQEYKLSELCLLCVVDVLIDKAKSFEKIISFSTKTIHQ